MKMLQNTVSDKHGGIFALLVALALLMTGVSFIHLSGPAHNAVLFGVAGLMAVLVGLQYMGLRRSPMLVYEIILVAFLLFAMLVVILIPDLVWHGSASSY
jgi:hypothetical protein